MIAASTPPADVCQRPVILASSRESAGRAATAIVGAVLECGVTNTMRMVPVPGTAVRHG